MIYYNIICVYVYVFTYNTYTIAYDIVGLARGRGAGSERGGPGARRDLHAGGRLQRHGPLYYTILYNTITYYTIL